jgi:LPXTG-motif cell wall-anchored protein
LHPGIIAGVAILGLIAIVFIFKKKKQTYEIK